MKEIKTIALDIDHEAKSMAKAYQTTELTSAELEDLISETTMDLMKTSAFADHDTRSERTEFIVDYLNKIENDELRTVIVADLVYRGLQMLQDELISSIPQFILDALREKMEEKEEEINPNDLF